MYTIDKNVPAPAVVSLGAPAKYPWRAMDVGDSFFVPGNKASAMTSAAAMTARRLGCKYTTRTVTENGVKGVRVWRVE